MHEILSFCSSEQSTIVPDQTIIIEEARDMADSWVIGRACFASFDIVPKAVKVKKK